MNTGVGSGTGARCGRVGGLLVGAQCSNREGGGGGFFVVVVVVVSGASFSPSPPLSSSSASSLPSTLKPGMSSSMSCCSFRTRRRVPNTLVTSAGAFIPDWNLRSFETGD